jgi:hypothetical protein
MKNRSIVEAIFGFLACRGMRPFALAFGKFDEVGDGLRRIFFKQAANDGSFAGFKRGVESGLASHEFPFENRSLIVSVLT